MKAKQESAGKRKRRAALGAALAVALAAFAHPSAARGEDINTAIEAAVGEFYRTEAARAVKVIKPAEPVNFDILFLHICSMSWNDLREAKLDDHPLFSLFHYLYTDFNSVTTYSGPAMVRLLKANCGQVPHAALYGDAPRGCYTMRALEDAGFRPWAVLNHNGAYGDFARELASAGKLGVPLMDLAGLPTKEKMFDGSPIYDDYGVLERWWDLRLASDRPAALYYNSVTLHDGAHWADDKYWFTRDRTQVYRSFATRQLDGLVKFLALLEKSGKNAVVVFIPEHGLGLRGTAMQGPALRDIPLPYLTKVPVGIRLVGKRFTGIPARQTVIGKPSGMLAVAYQLAYFIEHDPFGAEGNSSERPMLQGLPSAAGFLAENENARVFKYGPKYYLFAKDGKWAELRPDQVE